MTTLILNTLTNAHESGLFRRALTTLRSERRCRQGGPPAPGPIIDI